MEKIFTSLKLPGLFILLTSVMTSYLNYPATETYVYPKTLSEVSANWYDSPMGIFALGFSDEAEPPTLSVHGDINSPTDSGLCSASVTIPQVTYTGSSLTWSMSGASTDSGSGQVGTHSFEKGTTVITFTAPGDDGTSATDSMQITVSDEEAPVITAPTDVTATTSNDRSGNCTTTVALGTPTVSDNCEVDSVQASVNGDTINPTSFAFPVGTTIVTWTVTDKAGLSATATQKVTVTDDENPKITAPADKTATTSEDSPGNCTTTLALGSPSTSDNCEVDTVQASVNGNTIDPATYAFPVGTTTVTWTVTDKAGLSATATQKVTVTDDENPSITAPADKSETTSNDSLGNCTTTLALGTPSTSDNCEVDTVQASVNGNAIDPAIYAFPVGTTTVTWTVTDKAGLSATATQKVIVTDDENPSITAPDDKTATTSGDSLGNCTTTLALGTPTVSDNCEVGSVQASVNGNPIDPAIYAFPVGTTTVTWTLTDKAGLSATATQKVTVTDDENPSITAPADKTATTSDNGTGNCTTTVALGTPTVSDNCEVDTVQASVNGNAIDPATYAFPVGTTTVTWTVTDKAGLSVIATQTVTVTDDELPVITAGTNIKVPNISGQCYAGISISQATAADNCSVGSPVGVRSDGEAINSAYPVGITTIEWTVTDANGNAADPVVQTITVEDNEAPIPPVLENVVSGCVYTLEVPTAEDNCTSDVSVTHDRDLTFHTTGTVVWTFTDAAGNFSTAEQTVTIDPIATIVANKVDVLCNGHATGEIRVTATGGVAPYTFDWGTLGAGDTKTNLAAGTYRVTAMDANGCETAPLEVVIEEPETFVDITRVNTTTGCFGENNGTATVEATGGTGAYTYTWSNGQTTSTPTVEGLAPGNHSVTVIDENGCSKERSFTVSQPQKLEIAGFMTTETTLYGTATGTATVQISGGTPNYTFVWSNGQTGQTARDLAAGTYTVTVTDAYGCSTSKEVTIVDSLDANIVPTSICKNTNDVIRTSSFKVENLTAIGGTAPYNYHWVFEGDASIAEASGPQTPDIRYETIGDKVIHLTVTDVNGLTFTRTIIQYVGGCFTTDCGSNDLVADNFYVGDESGNHVENCETTGQKYIYIYVPSNPDRYSLNIEIIYSIEDIETGEIQNFRELGCFYSQQDIPDRAQTFPIEYSCTKNVKVEAIQFTFSNKRNDSCGEGNKPKCYSTNNEATVHSPLYAVAIANELLCFGSSDGTITARASGGKPTYQYQVKNEAGEVVKPYQENNIFTGLSAGVYTVEVKDTEGTVFPSRQVEIKQPKNPLTLEPGEIQNVTCFGGNDGSATVIASGGTPGGTGQYIYSWTGIGQTTATATNLSAGTYEVRVLDTNGCEEVLEVEITEPAELPANAGPDQVLECGNLSTTLAAVFEPEVVEGEELPKGTWTVVNGPSGGIIEDPNDPNSRFTGNIGTYTLRWTVPCGTSDDVKISFTSCSTLDFDGTNDHVIIGDKFDLPSGFTLEAWVKQDANKTSGKKTVLSKRDNSALNSGGFDLIVENNVPKFRWNGNEISSDYTIGTDRWYHLAVIVGGADAGLYIDGIKVSGSSPGSPTPISAPVIIGASYNSTTPLTPENYFHGWIEELRVWNKPLDTLQVRFLMNQRLKVGSSPLRGTALPLDAPGPLNFNEDIIAYYPLIVSEITNGTTVDKGSGGYHGKMVNIKTLQQNTAPLPYYSARNGAWTADATWKYPAVWDFPNSKGVDGTTFIDWNIVVSSHNITSQSKDIKVLGLKAEAGAAEKPARLTISNPSGPQNETNSGQSLTVTHYLLLDGVIDLVGESQLLQDTGSVLDASSKGYLERDQQGTASSYTYNYWTSPVSPGINTSYSVKGTMKDGTITTFRDLWFENAYHFADGHYSDPRKISNYWLHKFHGTANNYFSWEHIGSTGTLAVGEGYSMKGTSGSASNTDLQNYTFVGLPNNGEIILSIGETAEGENYLIGNPYPSSLDANQFLEDNVVLNDPQNSAFNGTLYFWDHFSKTTHYLEHYIGGYAAYNFAGSIEPASSVDSRIDNSDPLRTGSKRPGDYIPVGQAFFVNTVINPGEDQPQTTGRTTIKFTNNQRIYKREGIDRSNDRDQVVFFGTDKKGKSSNKAQEERQRIWIKYHSPKGYHRQLLVTADSRTSNGFDLGFDAPLIDNNVEDMYWMMNEQVELVIQGVPDFNADRVLPLGLKTAEGGKFVIKIDELENIGDEFAIFIKDNQTNTYFNLREGEFTATAEKGNIHERYSIVFSADDDPQTGEEEEEEETPSDGDGEDEDSGEDEGDGDGGDGDGGDEDGDGDGNQGNNPEQPAPTPPADIELLYSNRDALVVIKNDGMLPLQKAVLYNALGQEMFTYGKIPVQNRIELPVEVPSTGVYFVRVHLEDTTRILKFIVE